MKSGGGLFESIGGGGYILSMITALASVPVIKKKINVTSHLPLMCPKCPEFALNLLHQCKSAQVCSVDGALKAFTPSIPPPQSPNTQLKTPPLFPSLV